MVSIAHFPNWYAGWIMILAGFVCGAVIGLFFHREEFWGGYTSFRRRIVRLGHVALVALGMLNVLFALAVPGAGTAIGAASVLMIVGGITMPVTCFLAAWNGRFRHVFFIPVLSLLIAVALVLIGGLP